MCSVSDDLDCLSLTSSGSGTDKSLFHATCKKCRSEPAKVVVQLKEAFCKNCLLLYVNHRFRACLGKSKLIKPKEKILVAVSGSLASATLVDLIHCGLQDTTPKRLMFSPIIVFIDDGAALGLSNEQRLKIFQEMRIMLKNCGLSTFYVPLESVINFEHNDLKEIQSETTLSINECSVSKVRKIFEDLKSVTSKEDLLIKLRNNLLIQSALTLNCSKILTAETGTDLAVKLMSNIVIGRGAHLPLDVGFCDTRCTSVLLLRPLQDVSKKAVAFYVLMKGLKTVFIPAFSSIERKNCSLQKLTENFLVGLHCEFPSTMSTIFRTGEKLSLNPLSPNFGTSSCELCQGPLDIYATESSAYLATQISSAVSKYGKAAINSDGIHVMNHSSERAKNRILSSSCKNEANGTFFNPVCYGCQLILAESNNQIHLLQNSLRKHHNQILRDKMKEEIADFLIE
ncbi:unnamed protein product [Bemisia tabaci]|uniref:Cytoplasmic tRNA 2-thiolation protein 2 n=1 Tax=Bemisia tabaci TaxID=7038 RepID=A0A9P0AH33_BEMTA|nr:PREDICTED: cytoplasmic tRNA 2-thiolation protein 2 [Bemisia tabaci]CAH0391708.1 unnamed protein product [Bemisia tabaci]